MTRSLSVAFFNKNILILLALVALLVCVFLQPVVLSRPAYNFQITFDISQSMKVEDHLIDGKSVSRITAAKAAALRLLKALPCGSRIGWSVFTERRVVSLITPVEVCQHYDALLSSLNYVGGDMRWANASGVGKGLHASIRATHGLGETTKIIFMTDGHEAPPLRAGSRGMPKTDKYPVGGLIVGVGGVSPVRIPKTVDEDGRVTSYWQADEVVQRSDANFGQSNEELSKRQDVHLGKLGRLANLTYLPLDSTEQLAKAALTQSLAHKNNVPVDLRWIPAALALLFLCFRFMPVRFRGKRMSL